MEGNEAMAWMLALLVWVQSGEETYTVTIAVKSMHCDECRDTLVARLKALPGVKSAEPNAEKLTVSVTILEKHPIHLKTIQAAERSLMSTTSMFWGGAAYNNGVLPNKQYILGEAYTRDGKAAILYSLSAMTSYGHANLSLESDWQLMGAVEALNGLLLFGLTTAFLFGMIQKVWLLDDTRGP